MANSQHDDSGPVAHDHRAADGASNVSAAKRSLIVNVLVYTAARLLLVAILVAVMLGVTALLGVQFPLLVALAVAVVIQLPLAHLLLGGLRHRLTADMEVVGAGRRADKAQLRAQLRGEDTPG